MKIENRSALVISKSISESILPKIIFMGAVVTAEASFYESVAISAYGKSPGNTYKVSYFRHLFKLYKSRR